MKTIFLNLFLLVIICCFSVDSNLLMQHSELLDEIIFSMLIEEDVNHFHYELLTNFLASELRLKWEYNYSNMSIPNKFNYATRLAIGKWDVNNYITGIFFLRLEDFGFSAVKPRELLCNREWEVK